MLRIGIVGLGSVSATHLRAIERIGGAKLAAACDIDAAKREKVPQIPFYTELEEMLKKEKLDCLHICLPHFLHVPAVLLAARYRVNAFVEKPVGLNTADAERLLKDPDVQKIRVGVCLQNRYNETTRKALELIGSGAYGRVKGCKAIVAWDRRENYYSKDPWRGRLAEAGGGVMLSQAIHTIDLMEQFCGKPVWVKGMAGKLLLEEPEVEDTACAHISFENGVNAVFYGTVTHCCNSSIELEIVLENAVLCIKNDRLVRIETQGETVLAQNQIMTGGKPYYGYGHTNAIREFYLELEGKGGSHISIEEGMKSVALIDKILESARLGRRVFMEERHETV